MQTLNTIEDAKNVVRALPGYVPGTLRPRGFNEDRVVENNTTVVYRAQIWEYAQEFGLTNTHRDRQCKIVTKYADGDDPSQYTAVYLTLPVAQETVEGIDKKVMVKAGPQPIEYALDAVTFEAPTDAEAAAWPSTKVRGCDNVVVTPVDSGTGLNAFGEPYPVVTSYHRYPIAEVVNLGGVAAEWENLPRFTRIDVDTGMYESYDNNGNPVED